MYRLLLAAVCLLVPAYGQTYLGAMFVAEYQQKVLTVEAADRFFLIEYRVCTNCVSFTTLSSGTRSAEDFAVFEIASGKRREIDRCSGQCYVGDPEKMVRSALEKRNLLTADLKLAFDQIEEQKAYAAMPLYEVNGGAVSITKKGAKELREVRVDGRLVWRNPDAPRKVASAEGIVDANLSLEDSEGVEVVTIYGTAGKVLKRTSGKPRK